MLEPAITQITGTQQKIDAATVAPHHFGFGDAIDLKHKYPPGIVTGETPRITGNFLALVFQRRLNQERVATKLDNTNVFTTGHSDLI